MCNEFKVCDPAKSCLTKQKTDEKNWKKNEKWEKVKQQQDFFLSFIFL